MLPADGLERRGRKILQNVPSIADPMAPDTDQPYSKRSLIHTISLFINMYITDATVPIDVVHERELIANSV
jgi:hypothetical protein